MKAVTFLKPLEYTLKIDGESWPQGSQVVGTLEVKNHGAAQDVASRVQLFLARGELKKVHAKTPGALSVVAPLFPVETRNKKGDPSPWELPGAGETKTYDWKLDLDPNCPITDSVGSPFLVYGHTPTAVASEADLDVLGRIQMTVTSETIIQAFLHAFNVHFRFIIKSQRWSKSGTTATKLVPPDSKRFTNLEYITLTTEYRGENLELNYEFNEKKLESTAASVITKKEKREFEQTLAPSDVRIASGRINTDLFEQKIEEALKADEFLN